MNNEPENLMQATLDQIERVSGIIEIYKQIPNGFWAAPLMKADVEEAKRCINEGDTVGMINAYRELTGWSL